VGIKYITIPLPDSLRTTAIMGMLEETNNKRIRAPDRESINVLTESLGLAKHLFLRTTIPTPH
jgi:hypothetical protein